MEICVEGASILVMTSWFECHVLYMDQNVCIYDSLEVSEVQSLHFSIRSSIHNLKVGQMTEVATATIV